jgi:hypothetical protein
MTPLTPPIPSKIQSSDAIPALDPDDLMSTGTNQRFGFTHQHENTPAKRTLLELQRKKEQFAARSSNGEDNSCNAVDCSAVLHVYNKAIEVLENAPHKHQQIASECNLKVRIVLALLDADPDHPAFLSAGQLLPPLEPQYANPRIDAGDDDCSYRAQWRLNCWRKEGWPEVYPAKAIKRELNHERLVGMNRMIDAELRNKFFDEEGILGEEVRRRIATETKKGDKEKRGARNVKNVREPRVPVSLHDEELEEDGDSDEMDMDEELASWEDSEDDEPHTYDRN